MARPKRFELLTPRFVVWCSIQLSYGRVFAWHWALRARTHPNTVRTVAKERFSYPLRPRFARSAWWDLKGESTAGNLTPLPDARWGTPEISLQLQAIPGPSVARPNRAHRPPRGIFSRSRSMNVSAVRPHPDCRRRSRGASGTRGPPPAPHRPLNTGLRFSRNAASASLVSSVSARVAVWLCS
jgi:hypothetical protein